MALDAGIGVGVKDYVGNGAEEGVGRALGHDDAVATVFDKVEATMGGVGYDGDGSSGKGFAQGDGEAFESRREDEDVGGAHDAPGLVALDAPEAR